MGPSYLKRCATCKQCTLVWTQTPDMVRGFAASVTGPGHNRFLRVYGKFWFIFAWGNRFYGQKPEFGSWGSIYGGEGVVPFALTTESVMAGNFRSIGISDRISIAIA